MKKEHLAPSSKEHLMKKHLEVIDDLDKSILKCSFGGQNLTEVKKKNGMQRSGHSTNNLFSVSLQKRTE